MTFKSSKKIVAYLGIKYTITNLMLAAFFTGCITPLIIIFINISVS